MIKRIFIHLGVFCGLGFLFATSVWMNLSPQRITPWAELQLRQLLPKTINAKVQAVTPTMGGMLITQVDIFDKKNNEEIIRINELDVSFNVFRMLLNLGIPFSVKLYYGKVDGVVKFFPLRTDFKLSEIQPNYHKTLRKTNIIQSNPILTGSGTISLSRELEGQANFQLDELVLSGKNKDIKLGIELPNTTSKRITSSAQLKKERLSVKLEMSGNIAGRLEGSIQLDQKQPERSRLDMNFSGHMEKEYKNHLSYSLKQLIQLYSHSNGQIKIKIKGLLKSPEVQKI